MEWISTKDMLPDVGQAVLIFIGKGSSGFEALPISSCEFTKYGFERSRVSHWMPLPEPPKE